ncbi:MAG: hypothetical protein II249_04480 [Bacteroidaceae bacterium]|nr:hypothetical protein [Bacteroidaceae bacterium]
MNPIEFLKQNGLNPDNFRTPATSGDAPRDCRTQYYHSLRLTQPSSRDAKRATARRRNIADVRIDVINEWFDSGNKDLTGIFVPYLMLDVMQIISSEYLSKVDFTHKERKHYTHLMNDYHSFNTLFFSSLTSEQQDVVIQMFDDFGEYIHNKLEIFRFSIIGSIMQLPEQFRATCGDLCVCKLMISQTVRAWRNMYRRQYRLDDSSYQLLQSMEHHISELMSHYFKRENGLQEDINLSTVETVRRAEENVIKEILKFLKEYEYCNKELS